MLRSLISLNFQVMVTPDGVADWDQFASDYSKFSVERTGARSQIARYRWPGTNDTGKMILPGTNLSLIQRRVLAASPQKYFMKTHEWPQTHYVEGERVIQIVRHPGDALLSHAQLIHDHDGRNVDLEALIRGELEYGSWAGYHDTWMNAMLPKLLLRFEDVRENAADYIPAIAKFIGRSAPSELRVESFEQASQRNPKRNPKGRTDEWKTLPAATIRLMEKELGKTARRFGYEIGKRNLYQRFRENLF